MSFDEYTNVRLVGTFKRYIRIPTHSFTLYYTPLCKHGRPQALKLEAETETDAIFEAASNLECSWTEIPAVEWE